MFFCSQHQNHVMLFKFLFLTINVTGNWSHLGKENLKLGIKITISFRVS